LDLPPESVAILAAFAPLFSDRVWVKAQLLAVGALLATGDRPLGGAGGLRFSPIGSDEGGLDELVELSPSRAWRSRSWFSSSVIRCCIARNTAAMAAWASGGTVLQSSSGIGSGSLMTTM
jgi:hypothetical protein